MIRIVLMGNPNVGKSAIFSHLTGTRAWISNYPGTTVEFSKGYLRLGDGKIAEVLDAPGTYSLEPSCRAEEVAAELLRRADLVINVVDATNLERNLHLTLQIIEAGVPVVVALNLWDEAMHRGINVDPEGLERELGVPVVWTVGLTGEGMKDLVSRLTEGLALRKEKIQRSPEERWVEIGRISAAVQRITHRHHTRLEQLQDAMVKPVTGVPLAILAAVGAFKLVTFLGECIISHASEPFFQQAYLPLLKSVSFALGGGGLLHDVLVGRLVGGEISLEESLGVLSTGLYVDFGVVFPYLIAFYLVLGLLEDSGYLPRLAVLADQLFHRVGLHGYAIIPTLLGFGCNVPGVLAARNLESRRERFIVLTLMAITVPCAAQSAMIVGLVGRHGGGYLGVVFATLLLLWAVLGTLANRFVSGYTPPMLVELPPLRVPYWRAQVQKMWFRTSSFLFYATPYILGGVCFVNLLFTLGAIKYLAAAASPVIAGLFGLPAEAVSTLIVGFLRKDVAVAMLEPLNLNPKQFTVGATVLALYFPCAATFAVLYKEMGTRDTAKAALVMVATALVTGTFLNIVLDRVVAPWALAAFLASVAVIVLALAPQRRREAFPAEPSPARPAGSILQDYLDSRMRQ